ncbi:hypothetical protein T07_6891 [Trichinella nelsoni]|uniref:Uncharacterized protein n=1 Tax=Trichinella nelsoni TaxID=6336 RepID=A0A0V0RPD1_9BILA|nr:hypothetical protein T07_6891 [Trichinella nelsoni]
MSARGSASRCLGEIGTEFREAQRQVQNKKMKRNIKPGFFPLQQRDKQRKDNEQQTMEAKVMMRIMKGKKIPTDLPAVCIQPTQVTSGRREKKRKSPLTIKICSALFGGGHGGIAAGVGNVNLALETKPTEPAVFSQRAIVDNISMLNCHSTVKSGRWMDESSRQSGNYLLAGGKLRKAPQLFRANVPLKLFGGILFHRQPLKQCSELVENSK